jgi:hypothetical protein
METGEGFPVKKEPAEKIAITKDSKGEPLRYRRSRFRFKLCAFCVDCALTADVLLCGPCQASRQWMAAEGDAHHFSCKWCVLLTPIFPCAPTVIRWKIARRLLIDEGAFQTIVQGCCCPQCTLCQMNRELALRGVPPGSTLCGLAPIQVIE